MTNQWVRDELKKRSTKIFRKNKDPETGEERLEEIPEAGASFGFNTEELERWVRAGLLDKEDALVITRSNEDAVRSAKEIKSLTEKCREEGREPSQEEWFALPSRLPQESVEDIKRKIDVFRFIQDNREKLLEFLQPQPTHKGKFRQSGHVVDQKLMPEIPIERRIFEHLSPEAQGKVEEYAIRTTGIHLTPAQDKMVTALLLLLHRKSEHRDEKALGFYGGNEAAVSATYGKEERPMPVVRCSIAELCKAYLGKEEYGGAEIEHVKATLFETEKKKFLIAYDRKRVVQKGSAKETLTDRIEDVRSLFKIITYFEGLTGNELSALNRGDAEIRDKRGEVVIGFCPLLIDQIDKKYVEYPEDINRRMVVAAGGFNKVTEADNRLRDYLLREISAKRKKASINESKLIQILGLSGYKKEGRKKMVQQRILTAIQTCKNLGLLVDHKTLLGSEGQRKHEFTINEDFE
jgi:hypothetical protein